MKNLALLLVVSICLIASCSKDEQSERFRLLTGPLWRTDSLLANGVDASAPGGMLAKFKGDAKFEEDGTGYFGIYTGKWLFSADETQITIITDSLVLPIVSDIVELTGSSFKIKTMVPNPANLTESIKIRMTFKPK